MRIFLVLEVRQMHDDCRSVSHTQGARQHVSRSDEELQPVKQISGRHNPRERLSSGYTAGSLLLTLCSHSGSSDVYPCSLQLKRRGAS